MYRVVYDWMRGTAAVVGLGAFLAMSVGQAEAALVSCPGDFTANGTAKVHNGGGLTAASGCQYDPASSSNPGFPASKANIDSVGFFGTTDWTEVLMDVQTPNQSSGNWAIVGADFDAFEYMIVFKNGGGTYLTGFLLNGLYDSGGWSTPFTSPPFNLSGNSTKKNVSHFSIVKRAGEPDPVPEPGVLGLLGLGLLGLGLTAYTRRRRVA